MARTRFVSIVLLLLVPMGATGCLNSSPISTQIQQFKGQLAQVPSVTLSDFRNFKTDPKAHQHVLMYYNCLLQQQPSRGRNPLVLLVDKQTYAIKVATNPLPNAITLGTGISNISNQILPTISIGPQTTITGNSEVDFSVRAYQFSGIADAFRRIVIDDLISLITQYSGSVSSQVPIATVWIDPSKRTDEEKAKEDPVTRYVRDQLDDFASVKWSDVEDIAQDVVSGVYNAELAVKENQCQAGQGTPQTRPLERYRLVAVLLSDGRPALGGLALPVRSASVRGQEILVDASLASRAVGNQDSSVQLARSSTGPKTGGDDSEVLISLLIFDSATGNGWQPHQETRLMAPKILELQ